MYFSTQLFAPNFGLSYCKCSLCFNLTLTLNFLHRRNTQITKSQFVLWCQTKTVDRHSVQEICKFFLLKFKKKRAFPRKICELYAWTRRIKKFLRITRRCFRWICSLRVPFEFWMIPETTTVTIGIGTHGSVRLPITYSLHIRPINYRHTFYTHSSVSLI